jgi:DNA invertase Pin-like site-specific DNA recombinase
MAERKHLRCAIYTRKSSEEGLEQEFNSLTAQREACAAFIASQRHEGWTELRARYDDGGFSGGSLQRPGLARLLDDIRAKRVDVIVVYKVDRLTRSLADFAKIVEVLDAEGVSFVAVTQQFNTTTSMGRLTLNVLLSFAQFEREIAGERIRDKIKASRQKGLWMGGTVPLGYEVKDRALIVNEAEAKKVRLIFKRYIELGAVRALAEALDKKSIRSHRRLTQAGRTIGGKPLTRGNLYLILQNPVYLGRVVHKGTSYPGLHRPIIEPKVWDRAQDVLAKNRVDHRKQTRARVPSLLTGLVFDHAGERLTPSHANRGGLRYRYYISKALTRGRPRADAQGRRWRIPASEIEKAVLVALGSFLDDHSALISTLSLGRWPPAQAASVLKTATAVSRALGQEQTGELRCKLQSLLSRIEIGEATLTLTVALGRLREALKLPALSPDEPQTHAIVVPVRITKRGIEQKLVIGGGVTAPMARDEVLVKAVARAYSWFEDICRARVADVSELAVRERLPRSYVQAHLSLAFLAPSIVTAILEGRQPADLSLKQLMYRTDLAVRWPAQRRQLGFEV